MGDHDTIPTRICCECGQTIYWDWTSARWLEIRDITIHTPDICEARASLIGREKKPGRMFITYFTSGEYLAAQESRTR